jgi:hypothetical protein
VFFTILARLFKGLCGLFGQILFLAGVTLTIGINPAIQFFTKRQNFKGTISFGLGFLLVVFGWPIFGLLLESYGFLVLFSGFWPTLAVFLQRIPLLGWLLQQPYIRSVHSLQLLSVLLFRLICLIQSNFYQLYILVTESVAGSLPWKACPCLNLLCLSFFLFVCELTTIQL